MRDDTVSSGLFPGAQGHWADLAHQTLIESWRILLRPVRESSIYEDEQLFLASAGTIVPAFNPAFIKGRREDLLHLIPRILHFYERIARPFTVWLRSVQPIPNDLLTRYRLEERPGPISMLMRPIPMIPDPPGALTVTRPSNLIDQHRIFASSFHIPLAASRILLPESLL